MDKMRKAVETWLPVTAIGAALMAMTIGATNATAEPAETSWSGEKYGRVRLIAGEVGGRVMAGVEIRLDKGWKTYWRIPGDAGVPPDLDWSASANVARIRARFPAPKRMKDPIGYSLGYEDHVVFPVEFEAADLGKPVDLRLKLLYGVCREICIPAEASLELRLDPRSLKGVSPAIASALGKVPLPATTGEPEVVGARMDVSGPKPRLIVEARFPKGFEGADLFLEAEGGEYLPLPALPAETVAPDTLRFTSTLAPDDAQRLKGKALTLTLVSQAAQSETVLRLP
jgi:DsbC/DsbD-like thiol-disulfide interchange protein